MPPDYSRIATLEQMRTMIPNTAVEALGVEILSVDASHILLRMPMSDRARQPLGLLHGGISMLLSESAASMHACWDTDVSLCVPVGIEISGSHLESASDGHILARGTVLRRSSRLAVHHVEIVHEETNRILCVSRVTNFYRKLR